MLKLSRNLRLIIQDIIPRGFTRTINSPFKNDHLFLFPSLDVIFSPFCSMNFASLSAIIPRMKVITEVIRKNIHSRFRLGSLKGDIPKNADIAHTESPIAAPTAILIAWVYFFLNA